MIHSPGFPEYHQEIRGDWVVIQDRQQIALVIAATLETRAAHAAHLVAIPDDLAALAIAVATLVVTLAVGTLAALAVAALVVKEGWRIVPLTSRVPFCESVCTSQ